jgi:hypothetical protein
MKHGPVENLTKYYGGLTRTERVILCELLKPRYPAIHLGSLVFVPLDIAVGALHEAWSPHQRSERTIRQLLGKLPNKNVTHETFIMCLDDKKVYRRFGRNPERGKPLSHLPKVKVTVGFKWSLPKLSWIPDRDVLVTPTVALRQQRKGIWLVTVTSNCRALAEQWLFEHCGLTK